MKVLKKKAESLHRTRKSLPEKILVNNTFYLTPLEYEDSERFKTGHKKCKGSFKYTFDNGSGIGSAVTIECSVCGNKLDVTDMEYW